MTGREAENLLRAHGLYTEKGLGQNFLTDPAVPERIAAAVEAETVFEIGAGLGALTAPLCKKAEQVVTAELDERLRPLLAETVPFPNHTFLWRDVLKIPLPAVRAELMGGRPMAVAGNLPYYITAEILDWLLAAMPCWQSAVLMVQREAAERLTAAPGDKRYRASSAALQALCVPEKLFDVPPQSFYPAPHVMSTVLRLTPRKEIPADPARFLRFVKACFANRRKMTAASPAVQAFLQTDRAGVERWLAACGKPANDRAERWEPAAFLTGYRNLLDNTRI